MELGLGERFSSTNMLVNRQTNSVSVNYYLVKQENKPGKPKQGEEGRLRDT